MICNDVQPLVHCKIKQTFTELLYFLFWIYVDANTFVFLHKGTFWMLDSYFVAVFLHYAFATYTLSKISEYFNYHWKTEHFLNFAKYYLWPIFNHETAVLK